MNTARHESSVSFSSFSDTPWELDRKGNEDAARHKEKVMEAVKDNLRHLVAEEAIITVSGDKIIKVPMRGLEIPTFRYGGSGSGAGKGEGDGQGQGQAVGGEGAGKEPGIDYYEAEITVDDLASVLFGDLGLPFLEQKKQREQFDGETVVFTDVRKKGQMGNLDKRRTLLEAMKRGALAKGRAKLLDENGAVLDFEAGKKPKKIKIKDEDMRFKTWQPDIKKDTNAVIIAMRDVSGSMGEFQKFVSRSFYFWMLKFLRQRYQKVDVAFITHHTEAQEVDEDAFFKLGESGGTKASSAYKLARSMIHERYDPADWNVYPFHFSDGDNWGDTDNRECRETLEDLLKLSSMVGYGEIREGGRRGTSTLMTAFESVDNPRFRKVEIFSKDDVYPALRTFLGPSNVEGAVSRV